MKIIRKMILDDLSKKIKKAEEHAKETEDDYLNFEEKEKLKIWLISRNSTRKKCKTKR